VKAFDLIVSGAELVDAGARVRADLGVQDGRVAAIMTPGSGLEATEVVDAAGLLILPGAIDAHFHTGTTIGTGASFGDTIEQATRAAARGGVTTVLPYVWGNAGEPVGAFIDRYIAEFSADSFLDFSFHAGVRPDMDLIAQLPDAFERGVSSFKFHMDYRKTGGGRMTDDDHRLAAMAIIGRNGGLAMFHAENGYLIDALEDRFHAEGKTTWEYFLQSRPTVAESLAIHSVLEIGRLTNCDVYIPHLSSLEGLGEIERARASGSTVFAETCVQYLLLTNDDLEKSGGRTKVGPPIREQRDQDALWDGVRRGAIDTIASDHSAWPIGTKLAGEPDVFKILFGIPIVEEMVPLVVTQVLERERCSLFRMVEAFSERPARIFGIYPQKGTLRVGSDADFLLLDPQAIGSVDGAGQVGVGWSPFEGWGLRGRILETYQRGTRIVDQGIVAERQPVHYLRGER
jgi:dihydropyrimidinase